LKGKYIALFPLHCGVSVVEYTSKIKKAEELRMSNIVITKNSTYDERMQAIRESAERFAKIKARRARLAASAARVRKYVDEVDKPERKKFDDMIDKMDENHNHYTDGEKYLAEHYGERLADQTSYESEEGWN
jgi:hypothetical protein